MLKMRELFQLNKSVAFQGSHLRVFTLFYLFISLQFIFKIKVLLEVPFGGLKKEASSHQFHLVHLDGLAGGEAGEAGAGAGDRRHRWQHGRHRTDTTCYRRHLSILKKK
jgi:hypothetical protein